MSDPLTQVVELLRPRAVFANLISGKGDYAVRYAEYGRPSFCIMLKGQCLLDVDDHERVMLSAGDFVLLPTTPAFTIASMTPAAMPVHVDPHAVPGGQGERRYGMTGGAPDMLSLGGAFLFEDADPSLLVSLLPRVVHVQNSSRLALLVQMVGEEYDAQSPGNAFMLSRLAGMMLIEAMRSATARSAPAGLLRGLGDDRIGTVLQRMHGNVGHAWTVEQFADIAALSRSAFFDRFTRRVGASPMEYLLSWRMEIAKDLLRRESLPMVEIAELIGYASTSSFSTAFSRHVGVAPRTYARSHTEAALTKV